MTCDVRARCIGGIAAAAGTLQVQGILAGRQGLLGREVLYRPDEAFETVYMVRSGSLVSTIRCAGGQEEVAGFHFPGEMVGVDGMATGRQRVSVTALEETHLCVLRFAPRPSDSAGARSLLARLWDMMSCELLRERAHRSLLGTLAPKRRVAAFLASVAGRMRLRGRTQFLLPPGLCSARIASYLGVSTEPVDAVLHGTGL